MSVIKVDNISKDYGSKRGVFNLSFEVNRGEIFGMLGPNGAGKTTTIRQLMGFIKSDKGSAKILDMDCFVNRENIQLKLGYLPGEIAFMDEMKGSDFIRFIAEMKSIKSKKRINELTDLFELDANRKIKSMSKGTKQKIAIVCAFMNEPEVVILDEPTSGLDPLMQKKFIELILEEKKKVLLFLCHRIYLKKLKKHATELLY
ncbi:ABC transporter-like protein [Brachyspira pilosicoli P43/6/78]|uniref:ABC transporter-like protein n=1 Tax=Brachyspira pilosicoli P43/6/78 TaxID=1042417 RepID=A0A3B6VIM7_BRAPL|nr:ABC transporter ATP-binding protein [Brachyspira pilosicoli]AGA65648.1 ABC transporter-like protein [Brachyspira pilosicoli P43/6/78]